jgi:hypothetical protein
MKCLHCQAETSNGLALCERCQMAASIYLEFLPIYFRNLARWRPGRAGSRPVPGSRIPKGVIAEKGDEVGNALNQAGSDLDTWARCLTDDRGVQIPAAEGEASVVRVLCWVFSENLTSIATLDWAGEFVRALSEHETRLRQLTEKVAPGWYAGGCQHCETPTHVVPGLTWVTCGGCGATTYARDHLDVIIDEARGWTARPKRLAEAVVALVDTETSVPRLYTRIRQWAFDEKIAPIYRTEVDYKWSEEAGKMVLTQQDIGFPSYRFGEVIDLALAKGSRAKAAKAS